MVLVDYQKLHMTLFKMFSCVAFTSEIYLISQPQKRTLIFAPNSQSKNLQNFTARGSIRARIRLVSKSFVLESIKTFLQILILCFFVRLKSSTLSQNNFGKLFSTLHCLNSKLRNDLFIISFQNTHTQVAGNILSVF